MDEKVTKVSELDGQLQELYDGVSEYLIAVSVMQAASTRVAQTFSNITGSKDPQLKVSWSSLPRNTALSLAF